MGKERKKDHLANDRVSCCCRNLFLPTSIYKSINSQNINRPHFPFPRHIILLPTIPARSRSEPFKMSNFTDFTTLSPEELANFVCTKELCDVSLYGWVHYYPSLPGNILFLVSTVFEIFLNPMGISHFLLYGLSSSHTITSTACPKPYGDLSH